MWWLLACVSTEVEDPAPRAPDPVPAFTLAGCQQVETTPASLDEAQAVETTLYLDEDHLLAGAFVQGDSSSEWWQQWEGECATASLYRASEPGWNVRVEWTTECDEAGNPVFDWQLQEWWDEQGSQTMEGGREHTYTYDADGQMIEAVETLLDDARAPGSIFVTSYVWLNGHIVQSEEVSDGESTESHTYTWDGDLLLEDHQVTPWADLTSSYAYDEAGRLAESSRYEAHTAEWTGVRYAYSDDTPRVTATESSEDAWDHVTSTTTSTWTCPPDLPAR